VLSKCVCISLKCMLLYFRKVFYIYSNFWSSDKFLEPNGLPGSHPASCTKGTESFPGVKNGRGVTLTTHPLLVPWSCKSRAITLLPLRAVRPVQSLSSCSRVCLTYFFKVYIATFQHYSPCLSSLEYLWFVSRSCGWMLSAGRESDSSVFQFFEEISEWNR